MNGVQLIKYKNVTREKQQLLSGYFPAISISDRRRSKSLAMSATFFTPSLAFRHLSSKGGFPAPFLHRRVSGIFPPKVLASFIQRSFPASFL